MEQDEIVKEFVVGLGKMSPPIIDKDLVLKYITDIVVDSKSLSMFFLETDRYVKHSQTFQMGFLLHSLTSVLLYHPLGSAVRQVTNIVPTKVFVISQKEGEELKDNDNAMRYDLICQLLMNDNGLVKSLSEKMDTQRKLPKIEDGGEVTNPLFDPLAVKFSDSDKERPGDDLTEQTES